jgi:hypothetical protein
LQGAILRFACIFVLLFAQQAALTHAAWHAGEPGPEQHQDDGKASFHGGLCDLHHAFTQVLGGVQAAMPVCAIQHARNPLAARHGDSVSFVEFLAPLSRGPPSFS